MILRDLVAEYRHCAVGRCLKANLKMGWKHEYSVWMSDSSVKTKLYFHLYFANVIDTFVLLLFPSRYVPDQWVRCLSVLNVLR